MKWKCPVRPCSFESDSDKTWEQMDIKEKIHFRECVEQHLASKHSVSQIIYTLYILTLEAGSNQ